METATGVNQKYVKLLHNSFKKYEDITRNEPLADNGNDNVEMKTRLQSECHSCKKVEVTELLQKQKVEKYQTRDKVGQVSVPNQDTIVTKRYHYNAKKNKTSTYVSKKKECDVDSVLSETNSLSTDGVKKESKKSVRKGKQRHTSIRFSEEEDEIVMDAFMSAGISDLKKIPTGFLSDLGKRMKRNGYSIKNRYSLLKTKNSRLYQVRFTILDDKAIIEAAAENIKKVGSLSKSSIEDSEEMATKLCRNKNTFWKRYEYHLKPWLLSYYAKTLNLDIRIMLGSFLEENFDTVYDIDWDLVAERPEFSGHTASNLKRIFNKMAEKSAKHLNLSVDIVTLEQVADDARIVGSSRKVTERTKLRQMEIIEYFEKVIKAKGIKNFL